jgi:hypothetical protein
LQPYRGLIEAAVKAADEVAAAGSAPDDVFGHALRFGAGPEIFKCMSASIFLLLSGGAALNAARILKDSARLGGSTETARGVFLGALLGAAVGIGAESGADAASVPAGAIPAEWASRIAVSVKECLLITIFNYKLLLDGNLALQERVVLTSLVADIHVAVHGDASDHVEHVHRSHS